MNGMQRATLAPSRVAPLLRGRLGEPYVYAVTCASTQELLSSAHPEGAVAVCEHQTGGRGRLGRAWEAPPASSILCSVLLRPRPGRPIAQLSLIAGVAVADAVEEAGGGVTLVKWPNDVVAGGRKVAGILAEARGDAVVLGIGVNVNQGAEELPESAFPPAGSLRLLDGTERDRAPLLAALLRTLEARYQEWQRGGLATALADLRRRDFLLGRHVTTDRCAGVAAGIAPDGALIVEAGSRRTHVASGEVVTVDEIVGRTCSG